MSIFQAFVDLPEPSQEKSLERLAKLERVVQAAVEVSETKGWSSLKEEILDGLVESLKTRILLESKQTNPNINVICGLAGELKWAEKYADLHKMAAPFKAELLKLKNLNVNYGKSE